jgi:hypothetical protein
MTVTVAALFGSYGCAQSITRDTDETSLDGSTVRRDAGGTGDLGAPRDLGDAPEGGPLDDAGGRVDAGALRDWGELCGSACTHAIECRATGLDSVGACTRDCLDAEALFGTAGCRELAYQAIGCLESLPCSELEGLSPDETRCAPFFARINRTCGGG